jgi:hypothetical protein
MIVGVAMFMGVIPSVAVMVVPVGMRMGMGVLMDMIVVVPLMIMGVGVGMGVGMFVIVAAIMPLVVSMAVGIVVHRSSSGIIVMVRKGGSPGIPPFFL